MQRQLEILIAIMVAVVLGLTSLGNTQGVGNREDEEAIKAIVADMTDGFNKHDANAATRMYLPDADLVTVRGEVFEGKTEFEKGLAGILGTRAKDATLQTLDMRIRFIKPDVALVHVRNELSGLVTADGQQLPPHEKLSLRVFIKRGDDWRVAAFHHTSIAPFGGFASGQR